ncbi:unnamed protein product [Darwinula stevensoni]|uniref:Kringle domain-containing protein n=1 Tax=Darwinula stevensoni TaxID=69355 RepID=A0A7R9AFI5_9CRUS|nr:unnamed protein product [Darwinula stevensoni]CAG0902896.1 unnamed protein product [Darwinula stevensoni]
MNEISRLNLKQKNWRREIWIADRQKRGTEYVGTMRKTETRKNCLRWDSQPYGKLDDFNPDLTYEEHFQRNDPSTEENFCRNPTSKERPWCFVDGAEKKWEFCDIPLCPNHP